MPVLSDAAINRLASWATKQVLKETCDILRETRVPTASGGFTITYPKHNSDPIPCAVTNAGSPQEQLLSGQEVGFIPKIILLPKGTDVLGSDRIKVGTITYHVIDLFEPTSYEVCRRVLVRRTSLPVST
jgi:hypothetical protein